ncbi:flagellin [Pelagicoccus mobilis]|uniref:Flagellin C-terminal domain-containing protein n=1 Tax=Pelagicoccus mobilis TaxID=415221 RepID=A0A934RXV1_9BACT|nr:hypothetical protein [Pelagicoccus mobilis]MBK1878762.1 hypothetical protein [Pelagicoccus mobilis]
MSLEINAKDSSVHLQKLSGNQAPRTASKTNLSSHPTTTPLSENRDLSEAMKFDAESRRLETDQTNIANSYSFLQTQSAAIQLASEALERLLELKDLQKDSSDKAPYQDEFQELKSFIDNLTNKSFNGVPLFKEGGGSLTLAPSDSGTINIDQADLAGGLAAILQADELSSFNLEELNFSLRFLDTLEEANEEQSKTLASASEAVATKQSTLRATNSHLVDTNTAEESTRRARQNVMTEFGEAIIQHSKISPQNVLDLLE